MGIILKYSVGAAMILLTAELIVGQVRVDHGIVLTGTTATDKQVLGLPGSISPQDALSAVTEQSNAHRYATSVGNDWSYIAPGIVAPVLGTQLVLKASAPGGASTVSISVNGSGPYALVYAPDLLVPSSAIVESAILSVVFNGNDFQLMNQPVIKRLDCPIGTVAVNDKLCISTDQTSAIGIDFFTAISLCDSLGLRMCSWGEWYDACINATPLGLNDMLGNWEWTSDMVNEDGHSRWTGLWGCYSAGTGPVLNPNGMGRCCYSR